MPEEVSECPEALGPTLAENSALPIVEVYNLRFRTRDGNEFWAPVLVQDGELLRYPSAWLISAAQSNYSTSTLGSRAHALRRFAEYYGGLHAKVAASETESNPRAAALAVVRGFESALTRGPAELGWRPMPLRSARKLRMWFDMFCDWLVENSGFEPSDHPNPLVKGSKNTSIVQVENRIQRDMLGHLYTATMAFRDPEVRALDRHIPSWGRDISASAISVGEGGIDGEFAIGISVKSRPPMMSIDDYFVLLECCRSRRDWRGECLWLLLGAGCARVSEALNAYATDVHPCNGEAYVALANPVEGLINYHGEWISRRDFLKRRYGAIPRPMLPRDNPLRAGWKGMAINSIRCDEFADVANWANRGWALVEWLYPSFGEQFLYAWTQYRTD